MIKSEWKSILTHKFLLLSLIFVALIPMFYALIFLASMWDPYNHLNQLPVAIVNQDHRVKTEEFSFDLGHQIISKMKRTKHLDYHFVSETKAQQGIKTGQYYMALVIPKSFSKNATTLLTKHPKAMLLTYETSKGRSFTAASVSDDAANALKTQLSKEMTSFYVSALLHTIKKVTTSSGQTLLGVSKLSKGENQILTGDQAFSLGFLTYQNGLTHYLAGVKKLSAGTAQLSQGLEKLAIAIPNRDQELSVLTENLPQLQKGINRLNAQIVAAQTSASPQLQALTKECSEIASLLDALSPLIQKMNENTLRTAIHQQLASAIEHTAAYKNARPNDQKALISATDQATKTVLDQLEITKLTTAFSTVKTKVQTYETLSRQLNQEFTALKTNFQIINQANNLLTPRAVFAITAQEKGLSDIKQILTTTIVPASQTIATHNKTLADDATLIQSGTKHLTQDHQKILSALTKENSGLKLLKTNLKSANAALRLVSTGPKNVTEIAAPIHLTHTDSSHVPNNGTAVAPYMMSVALFVGAISICTVYNVYEVRRKPRSAWRWWASKASVLYALSLLQAFVMLLAIASLNGLNAKNSGTTLLALIAESFAYMSLVAFFNALLRKYSPLIILPLMVIQLSSSAGMFPIQLSSRIFRFFNPFVPMTYGIEALRDTISIGSSARLDITILFLITIGTSALTILYLHHAIAAKKYVQL